MTLPTREESESRCWDVIVVGAGAAGLMAAGSAAIAGNRVLLLEKNKKLGVKILMSGGTRCNITHHCDPRGIVEAFGKRQGSFLHSALAALPPEEVVLLMERLGVETKVESTGKVFPVSNRAIDVRDAMVRFATESGAEIRNLTPVLSIEKIPAAEEAVGQARFLVATEGEQLPARSVIVTTGGKSYPGCGTTGDGYAWLERLGHTMVGTVPALTPLLSNCQWANDLKGITIDPTMIEVLEPENSGVSSDAVASDTPNAPSKKSRKKNKPLSSTTNSFLFTHFGFSGPSALDVSREVARHEDRKSLRLRCDFLPSEKFESFVAWLNEKKQAHGKQLVTTFFNGMFPKRLAESIVLSAGIELDQKASELSKTKLMQLARQVKQAEFPLQGTLGFEKAEVTAGGISLKEVDSKTMQSKVVDGLFLAGEILDLDGPIGGFNFQAAWSTGWLAGQNV